MRSLRPFVTLSLLAAITMIALSVPPSSGAQSERDGPSAKYTVSVIGCLSADCGVPSDVVPPPVNGIVVTVSNADDGEVFSSCVTGDTAPGECVVDVRLVPTLAFTFDESTLPPGLALDANPIVITNEATEPAAQARLDVQLHPVEDTTPTLPPAMAPSSTEAPPTAAAVPGELPAVIAAGTCANVATGAPVAEIHGLVVPQGTPSGASGAIPVATAYAVLDVPLADLLATDHVLVVHASADPSALLACGAIGGVIDTNGALSIGLTGAGLEGPAGVAYLAPANDDASTGISLFLINPPAA